MHHVIQLYAQSPSHRLHADWSIQVDLAEAQKQFTASTQRARNTRLQLTLTMSDNDAHGHGLWQDADPGARPDATLVRALGSILRLTAQELQYPGVLDRLLGFDAPLLKLAARAYGLPNWADADEAGLVVDGQMWNPLRDHDAMQRMAAALGISLHPGQSPDEWPLAIGATAEATEPPEQNRDAALRRAAVKVAVAGMLAAEVTRLWLNPVPTFTLVPTTESLSFRDMPPGTTGIPLPPHPGAFGVQRKHHTHEGIDLYVPTGTPVHAVEAGTVTAVVPFTGPHAPSVSGASLDWWHNTWGVFVEGVSGTVVYAELQPLEGLAPGQKVAAGAPLGHILQVLKKDKGRPMSMLHLELHTLGSRVGPEWLVHEERPAVLRDPTPYLLTCTGVLPGTEL